MYVIHLGASGYPSNRASTQRIRLTLKGLKLTGYHPLVINKHSMHTKHYPKIILLEGIPVVFTSIITQRPDNFIIRNINRFTGVIGEALLLIKKRKKIHTAIVYTPSFGELVYYRIISKISGFKMIIQYVELRSSISERNTIFNKINDRLFDNYFFKFCDGVIAISDFLVKHINGLNSKLPVIKIPAMCDFAEVHQIKPYYDGKEYIMYCGSIAYSEVIEFIIDIFVAFKADKKYLGNLILIITGDDDENWKKIREKIFNTSFSNNIIIKSDIPYIDLLSLYKGSKILMIPLRDTIQDKARFPHKIGEYTASGRPILSTNIGELKVYFIDGISAILADEYNVSGYVNKLASIIEDDKRLDSIAKKGFEIGMNSFDYRTQGLKLKEFISDL